MLVTIGLALMTAAAAAWGWRHWQSWRRNIRFLSKTHDAFAACGQLLTLVRYLQQHRGMSIALLGGDASYESKIAAKHNQVLTVIAGLNRIAMHDSSEAHTCFTNQNLGLFRLKWQSFALRLKDLSPVQSMALHGQMIARVLGWLAECGEVRIELPAGEYLPPGAARSFYRGLPALTETLGQARAIGMGVAISGGCTPMARVRLLFLTTRAGYLLQRSAAVCAMGPKGCGARIAVQELVNVIRYEMLASSGVTIGTDRYYKLATVAIDSVFSWIGECGAELESALHSEFRRTWLQSGLQSADCGACGWAQGQP